MFKKLLSSIIIGGFLLSINTYAQFTDVKKAHPHYQAINLLQQNGTISGYPDGTFKPNNSINRVEFLKLLLEGSNIPTNVQENTPFSDINHQDWYGPYVKKAYKEGWIQGYPDGTFKPNQNINKVETLKIIALAQKWQIKETQTSQPFNDTPHDSWYINYLHFAKTQNLLPEIYQQQQNYQPAAHITRGSVSEIIYRTQINGLSQPTKQEPQKEPEPEPETPTTPPPTDSPTNTEPQKEPQPPITPPNNQTTIIDFTPVEPTYISTIHFNDITLKNSMPNTFYQNELYILEGEVNKKNNQEKVATAVIVGKTDPNFRKEITDQFINKFQIPLYFKEPGNYQIGVIIGDEGSSKSVAISVLPNIEENLYLPGPVKPTNLKITYEDQTTYLSYQTPKDTLKKITFKQNNLQTQIFNRQNLDKIPLNYAAFENLKPRNTTLYIEIAKANYTDNLTRNSIYHKSDEITFSATNHNFSSVKDSTTAKPPKTLASSATPINFTGTTYTDLNKEALVITPEGKIETLQLQTNATTSSYLGTPIITTGSEFTFNYKPKRNGTYIIEINDKGGVAVINHPIYIGPAIPLIPDYLDLNTIQLFSGTFNLNNERNKLLTLINKERQTRGLKPLTLSTELNSLAQAHARDMVENDFFGHINKKGQTANIRRLEAKIPTPVGENLTRKTSVEFGHFNLIRSAAHLANIINPHWERVGLGLIEKEGYITIVQEFSTNEVTTSDLKKFEEQLFQSINNLREIKLTKTENLQNAATQLNQQIANPQNGTNDQLFSQILTTNNIPGQSQALIHSNNIWQEMIQSILQTDINTIKDPSWRKIGINLLKAETGNLFTTIIFNNQ